MTLGLLEQKPTHGSIISWFHELAGEERRLDNAVTIEEDLYFQKYQMDVPEGHRAVRLGTAPADVDQALESAAPGDQIGVEVRGAKDTQDWADRADDREKWIRSLLDLWRKPDDFVRQLLWGMLVQRKRWLQVSYQPVAPEPQPTPLQNETWDSWDARYGDWKSAQDADVPLAIEIKPRGCVFGRESSSGKLLYVFESYTRTIADLLYWYPAKQFPALAAIVKDRSPNESVPFFAFWGKDWRAAYVEDRPIFPGQKGERAGDRGIIRNEYGFIPFVPAYFRKLPVSDPERQYRGFLSNAVDDYQTESLLASQYFTIISRAAWPVVLTRFLDNRKFVQKPGWQFPLKPGEAVEAFNGQGPVPEVGQAWDRIRAAIRQNALGASAGNMPPGVRSAEALSMMQGVDRNKIASALRSLQLALEQCVVMALKIVENLHQRPVTLPIADVNKIKGRGRALQVITLKPEDIRGYYDCNLSFGPSFGMDVIQRAQALNGLVKDKFIARERAWRALPEMVPSIADATQEMIQDASDQHPMMVLGHVMRRLSTFDPLMFQYMKEVGAFNGPNGGGAPGGGGAPSASAPALPPPPGQHGPAPGGNGGGGQQVGQAQAGASPVAPMVSAGR